MCFVAPHSSREEVIDSSQGSRKYVFVPPQHEAVAIFLYGLDEEGVEPAERMSLARLAATRQHESEITDAISAAEAVRISIENFTARGREPVRLLETGCKGFGLRQSMTVVGRRRRGGDAPEELSLGDIAYYNYMLALEQDAEKRKGILEYARRRYNKVYSRGVLEARLDSFGEW